ncbi:MAG: amino acid adenylation domain-containing protein [Clostridia bacterium]
MNRISVLSYLDEIYQKHPDKTAFASETGSVTFLQLYQRSRAAGSWLAAHGFYKKPVVVFMRKSPDMINAFLGVVRGGCYYVPIDEEMPAHRISLIFDTLKPELVICDDTTERAAQALRQDGANSFQMVKYDVLRNYAVSEEALLEIRQKTIDTDPIYIVFTSGSTGIPKGVVACHRSVIDYIENLSEILRVSENTVFGNQAPLYVDACLKEIYPTLKYGASAYLIPKQLFMFPVKLVEYLNTHKINTICWVVPALTLISSLGTFRTVVPETLRTIAFGSEVFPVKQFNLWKQQLPEARFINLYGPTEATGMSCYYEAEREFAPDETIPIGKPFRNTEILLLDEENKPAAPGQTGEICIRGTSLTMGYYKDFTRTDAAFVQNPLNSAYHELIYRTGDLGRYNERGELLFLSRKDYQIKHMGHRIELGEIEMLANKNSGVACSCCIFDKERSKIILYYVGAAQEDALRSDLKTRLPRYMLPAVIRRIEALPLTTNGKINRLALMELYQQEGK